MKGKHSNTYRQKFNNQQTLYGPRFLTLSYPHEAPWYSREYSFIIDFMPASVIIPAIVSSIVGAVMDAPVTDPASVPPYASRSTRNFSGQTKKGEMLPILAPGRIVIDGNEYRTSAVLQARGPTNLIITPTTIRQPTVVRYQFDTYGNVSRLWVLSQAEIAAEAASSESNVPDDSQPVVGVSR